MLDALDQLSKVSGLPRTEMISLAEHVMANLRLLDSCLWHEFDMVPSSAVSRLRQKYRCRHCHGVIDGRSYHWFQVGRRAKPDSESGD